MKIYKVQVTDATGKEVAEFGYYEDEDEAITRRLDIMKQCSYPGNFEIKEIQVNEKVKEEVPEKEPNYYNLK